MSPTPTSAADDPARTPVDGQVESSRGVPTLDVELSLLVGGRTLVACVDECGRGAFAGPVSVGVVIVDASVGPPPAGVADSKLLSPATRDALVDPIRRWAVASGVGHASAAEVDDWSLTVALRLAGRRALAAAGVHADVVLLDGVHDWLSTPAQTSMFGPDLSGIVEAPPVVCRPKADLECAGVAAASVLAKSERDEVMAVLDATHPGYGWATNSGYGTRAHLDAIAELGLSAEHRRTWRLAG